MVASVVRERSPEFESKLKLQEADNPRFGFLADERVRDVGFHRVLVFLMSSKSRSFRFYKSLLESSDRVELPFWDDVGDLNL
jgi:Surp module